MSIPQMALAYGNAEASIMQTFDSTMIPLTDTLPLMSSPAMRRMTGSGMPGAVLLSVPMSQEGSGTSWHPASNPVYALMYHSEDWITMIHGHISPRYTYQSDRRGGSAFDAPNYIMGMAQRLVGENTQIAFRTMLSVDRLTEGGSGYPLLLQTGERWQGTLLVDRQHPHDLFSELSAALSTEFSQRLSGFLYLGYPGEPAIGPPAFMHRLSAMSEPDAPISHHWQDATHITFGVITAGLAFANVKIEGSLFNGREPDEDRFNFDKPYIDSYSGRISYNPTSDIALQYSRGFFKNPERDLSNSWLSTASAIYTHVFDRSEWISNTLVWSSKKDHHALTDQVSALFESEFHVDVYSLYTRFEYVEKPQVDLGLGFSPFQKEPLRELTFGLTRRMIQFQKLDLDLGVQATLNAIPENIAFVWGGEHPYGYEVFLSVHPSMLGR